MRRHTHPHSSPIGWTLDQEGVMGNGALTVISFYAAPAWVTLGYVAGTWVCKRSRQK